MTVVAWSVPSMTSPPAPTKHAATLSLSYSADVTPNNVYHDGTVAPGAHIYVNALPKLDLSLSFDVAAAAQEHVSGTVDVFAKLSFAGDQYGTYFLGHKAFTGTSGKFSVPLDIFVLTSARAGFSSTSKEKKPDAIVSIEPTLHLSGVKAPPVVTTYTPSFPFLLTDTELQPVHGYATSTTQSTPSVTSSGLAR